ncbi:MAG: iron donor protein CyaY [Proteobacteria bacterium]|nr:iron donor protein CyaY [Pseudomonadota bacterium]
MTKMSGGKLMNEQQFHETVDALFLRIEEWIEKTNAQLDFELQEGILTIILPAQSRIVLSRQTAMKEVWLASPLGAYHFQWNAGLWQTKQGLSLLNVLAAALQQNANVDVDLSTFQS